MVLEGRLRNVNSWRQSWSDSHPPNNTMRLISDNTGMENYSDSNMIQKGSATLLQCFPKAYFAADVDRSKCLYVTSSNMLFYMHYIGNVICHKFSPGDVSYRFNAKKLTSCLNIGYHMPELRGRTITAVWYEPPHDKTNKITVRPLKTQISLGICPIWSVFAVPSMGSCGPNLSLCRQRRLIRLGGCPGWSESSQSPHAIFSSPVRSTRRAIVVTLVVCIRVQCIKVLCSSFA